MDGRGSGPVPSLSRCVPRFRSRRFAVLLALAVGLAAQAASAAQLQLTWVDASGGQAAFRIERKADADSTYAELALQGHGVTAYTDATVLASVTYCYRVQAYNEAGVSPYSNEACGSEATGLILTVSLGGTGQGTASSSPAGISCGSDCVESYPSGTVVTLSATAGGGSTFAGWNGGGCAGTDLCTLTGNAPVTVSATFTTAPPASYTLSVAKSGPGTVTSGPLGINCGSDCSESYPSGTVVTLTATPARGARLVGWKGQCSGTGACSVVLNAATSVSATFTKSKGQK